MNKLKIALPICMVLAMIVGCAGNTLSPAPESPICDDSAYADSLICKRLRSAGMEAEQARDILLDANAIALIMEAYTPEQLMTKLDEWESFIGRVDASYVLFYLKVVDDTKKAKQVAGILERRLPVFSSGDILSDSDRSLLKAMIGELRDSV